MTDKRLLTPKELKELIYLENGELVDGNRTHDAVRIAKAQLAKVDKGTGEVSSPDREIEKKIDEIINDARSTAYADAKAGKLAYRIGTMDFKKAIIALLDPDQIRKEHQAEILKLSRHIATRSGQIAMLKKELDQARKQEMKVEDEFVKAFAKDYLETHEALHKADIEQAKREERIEIGLQIHQQWSKVTSGKDYSPYKLVDFLEDVITKLNKGQSLKGN